MKNILIILSVLLLAINLNAQNCQYARGYFDTQADVDDFVATYGSCNTVKSIELRADLDFSALSFIDTISWALEVSAGVSSMVGFKNVKHVGRLSIVTYLSPVIPDFNILKLESVGSVTISNAILPDLGFIENVERIDILNIRTASFTNPAGLSLPNLNRVYSLDLAYETGLNDLNIFNDVDTIHYVKIKSTSVNTINPLSNVDVLENLHLENNDLLNSINFSGFTSLKEIRIDGGALSTASNLNIDSLSSIDIDGTQLTDLSFLSNVQAIDDLFLKDVNISTLEHLDGISLRHLSLNNTAISDLNGLENLTSIHRLGLVNNQNLSSIEQLNSLQIGIDQTEGGISISFNPLLEECCVLTLINQLVPPSSNFTINVSYNGGSCESIEQVIETCEDDDGDGVFDYDDNCPNAANPLQEDLDQDGVGDVCDNCASTVSVQLSTQAEVDAFESTLLDACVLQNLFIEGDDDIVDLRPLSFLTSINGTLGIVDNEKLQSLDGLENLTNVGATLYIFSNNALTNIDALSGLRSVGEITIDETNLLESIDALSSLETINGNVTIANNNSLSYCCSLEPFISGEKTITGTISLSPNLPGCNTTAEISSACTDLDDDSFINIDDNCPNLYNYRQDDFDGDGIGDVCDNCPRVYNPNQINQDGDTYGDACDRCPTIIGNSLDSNNNGIGDDCEGLAGQENGFIGLGTAPAAKVEVAEGDLYLENVYRGVIMRSANGSCFRMKVQNDGSFVSVPIDCPQN